MEAIGPLLILVSIPLICRWIPPNRFYGFRIPATRTSPSVWYDANALAGRHMLMLGGFMVALEFILPVSVRIPALSTIGTLGMVLFIIADWRTANRWRREREHRSPTSASGR